jgi:transcriptional regulator with XRE-family HTH domain
MRHYGKEIKGMRKEAKWSQTDLANETGLVQTSISGWEQNSLPPLEFIVKSLQVLRPGLSLSDFFRDDEDDAKQLDIPAEYIEVIRAISRKHPNVQKKLWKIIIEQTELIEEVENQNKK